MNTLREIGEFVGLGNATPSHPGKPIRAQITMRSVSHNVPVLNNTERTSMRAMILGLQKLPPISLEAEAEDTIGDVPLQPILHIHPSPGVILETNFALIRNGKELLDKSEQGNGPDRFSFFTVGDPGSYFCEVTRIGIPNTGITTLKKSFEIIARVKPVPPVPDPPIILPEISVVSNGDGSFKVSGSGFVPKNATVNILVGDGTLNPKNPFNFTVTATDGAFKDFPTGKICPGSGTLLSFEASDGRIDHGSQVFTKTVKISCPFSNQNDG